MKNIVTSALMILVMTIALGIVFPLAVTAIAQVIFPEKATGSLVKNANGEIVGSELLAQFFTGDNYFHPRPSAAGADGCDAASSDGSNLGATSRKLIDRVKTDSENLQKENPIQKIPVELLTTSASGFDPDISPATAEFQIPHVAKARNISETDLRKIVSANTQGRQFGIFGEPLINVLKLNLELDKTR